MPDQTITQGFDLRPATAARVLRFAGIALAVTAALAAGSAAVIATAAYIILTTGSLPI
jgi:hypothetical protein